MGGPSAAVKAARGRAAAGAPAAGVPVPAENAAVAQALAVLAGVTGDAGVVTPPVSRPGRKPKVVLPSAGDVASDITAAAIGNLRVKNDYTSGAKGFFASAKSSFGDLKYQITLMMVLVGSSPKSAKFDKSFKVTVDLKTAAELVAQHLPSSLTATVFKSKSDGFRINGRFSVSDTEKYVLLGTAVRQGSAAK